MLALGVTNAVVPEVLGAVPKVTVTPPAVYPVPETSPVAVSRCRGIDGGACQVQGSLESVCRGGSSDNASAKVVVADKQLTLETGTHCLRVCHDLTLKFVD